MTSEQIKQAMQAIIAQYGEWTAHTIYLGEGIYTLDRANDRYGSQTLNNAAKLRRILRIASDIVSKPLSQCRVLDLGALEGMFAIEFALHGAQVIGIEGREANLAKAQFAKEALQLSNLRFVLDDVRNLKSYGQFDIILCLGILYHLDAPDVFKFTEAMSEACLRLTIIDTHFATEAKITHQYKGRQYQGIQFVEHSQTATVEEKADNKWASLENSESFWPTRSSLYNILSDSEFSSVMTIESPFYYEQWNNREMFVAMKGAVADVLAIPDKAEARHPEQASRNPFPL